VIYNRLLLALSIPLILALTVPVSADALASIMAAKIIKVAVPQDFPPFGFVGPDQQLQGYDIDMADLIAKALGVRTERIPVTSADRIAYVQTHRADIVISSLGKTPEREKVIDFSVAYAPFFSGVFGTKDIRVDKPADLAGTTVAVTRGAVEDQSLSNLAPASASIKRFDSNNATIAAFLSGQVDLIATGNTVSAVIAERNPERAPLLKFLIKDSPCYVGLKKGEPALRSRLNAIIAKAKADGELEMLSEKWLKAPLPSGF